jgi:TonB family protein
MRIEVRSGFMVLFAPVLMPVFALLLTLPLLGSCAPARRTAQPGSSQLFVTATHAFAAGDYARTAALLEQYLTADPQATYYEAFAFQAFSLQSLGRTEEGKAAFAKGLALVLADPGHYQVNAASELREWEEIYPRFPDALRSENGFALRDEPPTVKSVDAPEYPVTARSEGIRGTVLVRVLVDEKGLPLECRLQKSVWGTLDEAALAAARSLAFVPGKHFGRPAKFWVTVPFEFVP